MADYHSLLMRAVANLPNAGTPATRAVIYGRARKALLEQLRSLRPPLPESDITREESALDAAIAEVEGRYGSQDPAPPPASEPPTPTSPASRKAGRGACEGGPPAPASAILYGSAPQRAFCARAGLPLGAIAFANGSARPIRGRSHARSRRGAAISVADAREDPARREPAASANPACGEARRRGGNGGFAGSIPIGCCNGQPTLLRIEDRPGRSIGRGEGRQG